MAKVIGRDESAVKKCTCRHCAARLEYTERETQEYHGTDISGGPDGCKFIICPNCGGRVILLSW